MSQEQKATTSECLEVTKSKPKEKRKKANFMLLIEN